MNYALARACRQLGPPHIPVRTLRLRYSVPLDEASALPRRFNKTVLDDAATGSFTIFVVDYPEQKLTRYMPLSHEVAHLLNARLLDVYVEGLNSVFARKLYRHMGWSWQRWKPLVEDPDDLYGLSMRMMEEVWTAAGDADIRRLLSFAVPNEVFTSRQFLDINAWLATLEVGKRARITAIIGRYAPALDQKRVDAYGVELAFMLPTDDKR